MFRTPRTLAAAVAAAAVLVLSAGTAAIAAPSGSATVTAGEQAEAFSLQDVVCTVNDNGVNYRSGPGSQYPVMGTVNKGQKINAHGREGSWVMGDLWGGPTGVWIHTAYLDC
ncbi:SH3 domain-containing protein [Streptomyces sp. NPDC003077]|uniref:SH3 domain-containing protein n=1 Tax=Streptomyces sp. NPDC003077 TaxID=3154443 RepID=UPI0033B2CC4A